MEKYKYIYIYTSLIAIAVPIQNVMMYITYKSSVQILQESHSFHVHKRCIYTFTANIKTKKSHIPTITVTRALKHTTQIHTSVPRREPAITESTQART